MNKISTLIVKFLLSLFSLCLIAYLALILTGHKYIFTGLTRTYFRGNKTANIDDHTAFHTRKIAAATPQPWPLHENYKKKHLSEEFKKELETNDAAAFLIAHQGKLLAEEYFSGYDESSKTNSFSMAKTIVTLLLGLALEDGYLNGLDQPIIDLLPEFKKDENGRSATIRSLTEMTSGYEWDEHYYSPRSPTVELLYGDNVEKFLFKGDFTHKPGTFFYYSSASTELLAIAITRALKKQDPEATLSGYLSEKIWKPLGMNDDGLWHLDANEMELAYCCISTNVRNFAKLGQLMLQDGRWNGEQLLPASFVRQMHTPKATSFYGYSTWIRDDYKARYYLFRGHLGQFIIVVPEHELVVVRLGMSRGNDVDGMTDKYVNMALELIVRAN